MSVCLHAYEDSYLKTVLERMRGPSLSLSLSQPKVRALLRFAKESTMEVTTASKLRQGAQREGSRPAPFHAALLVREERKKWRASKSHRGRDKE